MSKRKLSDSVGNRQTKRRAQQEVNEILAATTFDHFNELLEGSTQCLNSI